WRGLAARILELLHPLDHLVEPGLELLAAARAVGREAAHQAFAAAGERQRRIGDQEHRRGDGRHRQALHELADFGLRHDQMVPTVGVVAVTPAAANASNWASL